MGVTTAVSQPLFVIVVGDHWEYREALVSSLRSMPGLEVGSAVTADEALELAGSRLPDVFVCDLDVPGQDPCAVLDRIRDRHPEVPCVVITHSASPSLFSRAISSGARAYLLKHEIEGPNCVAAAVRAAAQGAYYFSGAGVRDLLSSFFSEAVSGVTPYKLTERELQVLELVAAGLPNKLISRELSITDQAVKNYVGRIFRKLGVTNRTAAALLALHEGIVQWEAGPSAPPPP